MGGESYQVVKYTKDNLIAFFIQGAFNARPSYVEQKRQLTYLDEVCRALKVKTLVYERSYLDRHFSEDYVGYYARCFQPYRKLCSRLHFFSESFSKRAITNVLTGRTRTELATFAKRFGYKGFVVIKPLPETFVGRTCIEPFALVSQTSEITTIAPHSANIFGIDASLSSIPFQEQDREVAACATSALWTMLHGTAALFQHQVLSPLEITRAALSKFPPLEGRALPNGGLDMFQMASVVRHVGLEADVLDASVKHLLQATAYAYLRGGIPLLLGIDFNLDPRKHPELHAVALTGYDLNVSPAVPIGKSQTLLRATRIGAFYAHDDGVGPFSRLEFVAYGNALATSWASKNRETKDALPAQLLIPLYQQIRTPFGGILEGIVEFDRLVEQFRRMILSFPLTHRLEWDIYLVSVANLKREILADKSLSPAERQRLLTQSFPKFLWRATAYDAGARKLDLLFDATDLLQGRQIVHSICHDPLLEKTLSAELSKASYEQMVSRSLSKAIVVNFT